MPDDRRTRIRERLVDPAGVARLFGIETRARLGRRSIDVRCFAHDDREASLRLFVGGDGTLGFHCHAASCGIGGDVLTMIRLRSPESALDFPKVLEIGERLLGGAALPPVPPRSNPGLPPSPGALRRVLAKCRATADDAEVSAWLRARALDAAAIDASGAARALAAAGGGLPEFARFWPTSGHRLIVQAYDATGAFSTVRARRVVDATARSGGRKVLAPASGSTAGAVLANPAGLALLRGDAGAPRTVVVVEGETDLLSLPANDVAGLGLIARGSWTPKLGRACWGRDVVLAVDDDEAGDTFAEDVLETVSGRATVRDVFAASRGFRAAGHPLAGSGDMNDLLRAGVDLGKLFGRASVTSDPATATFIAPELAQDGTEDELTTDEPRAAPEAVQRSVEQALRHIERTRRYVVLSDVQARILGALVAFAWWYKFDGPHADRLGQRLGQCAPGKAALARAAKVSARQVQREFQELHRLGFVDVQRRPTDPGARDLTHLFKLPPDLVAAGMAGRT